GLVAVAEDHFRARAGARQLAGKISGAVEAQTFDTHGHFDGTNAALQKRTLRRRQAVRLLVARDDVRALHVPADGLERRQGTIFDAEPQALFGHLDVLALNRRRPRVP